jgi:valyl-tRNA synthetase
VRYWAASGRPGVDTAFDAGQMKVGRRLSIKLLNAAKFALGGSLNTGAVTEPLDRAFLANLAHLVRECTNDFEAYDYARALQRTETAFWQFCDDYLELIKSRRYGDRGEALAASANTAMLVALSTFLRLFAPFLPFVTEEVWSWWQAGSIHRSAWPVPEDIEAVAGGTGDAATLARASELLAEIRRWKSLNKVSISAPVNVTLSFEAGAYEDLPVYELDLRAAGRVQDLRRVTGTAGVIVEPVEQTA